MTEAAKLNGEQIEALSLFETLPVFVANGFVPCTPLFDVGIDLLAFKEQSNRQDVTLKIQAKSRFTLSKKYFGRNIWMLFLNAPKNGARDCFLCPHDQMIEMVDGEMKESDSWVNKGGYSQTFDLPSKQYSFLENYRLKSVLMKLSDHKFENRKLAVSWLVQK
jgi:hypothetical protein